MIAYSDPCSEAASCIALRGDAAYIPLPSKKPVSIRIYRSTGKIEYYSVQPGTNVVWRVEQLTQKKHFDYSCEDNMDLIVTAITTNVPNSESNKSCKSEEEPKFLKKFWGCQKVRN